MGIASSATDLGFFPRSAFQMRKSGKLDLRGRLAMTPWGEIRPPGPSAPR
jgi:hypothetical protein